MKERSGCSDKSGEEKTRKRKLGRVVNSGGVPTHGGLQENSY